MRPCRLCCPAIRCDRAKPVFVVNGVADYDSIRMPLGIVADANGYQFMECIDLFRHQSKKHTTAFPAGQRKRAGIVGQGHGGFPIERAGWDFNGNAIDRRPGVAGAKRRAPWSHLRRSYRDILCRVQNEPALTLP